MKKKKGFPEEGELVLATVTKILPNSVFANLDEYENKDGMIHISEVSPGRIRTLRDFVREGKKIVCKVIKVDKEKGYIDLSIRRVTQLARINKLNEIKQEQKAEKILEDIAKKLKQDLNKIYSDLAIVVEEYGSIGRFFQALAFDDKIIEKFNLDKNLKNLILEIVKEKIKPRKVKITGHLVLKTTAENGIDVIKEILTKIEKNDVAINYIGAPRYRVTVTADDYKIAENLLKEATDFALNEIKKQHGEGEFLRQK